eukprot:scaffold1117_cov379-Prasinococcus_capsulatus_cf.AAC.10
MGAARRTDPAVLPWPTRQIASDGADAGCRPRGPARASGAWADVSAGGSAADRRRLPRHRPSR